MSDHRPYAITSKNLTSCWTVTVRVFWVFHSSGPLLKVAGLILSAGVSAVSRKTAYMGIFFHVTITLEALGILCIRDTVTKTRDVIENKDGAGQRI